MIVAGGKEAMKAETLSLCHLYKFCSWSYKAV